MYCPACRQERLGSASQCVVCGNRLAARARSAIEAELAHVHFLLDEVRRWNVHDVPPHVGRHLTERYERQARILLSVLTEMPVEARPSVPIKLGSEAVAPQAMGEGAVALGPVTLPTVDAVADEASVEQVAAEVPTSTEHASPVAHVAAADTAVADATTAPDASAAVPEASSTPGSTGASFHFNSLDLI
ncbi:MAG: hypothetical protein EOO70_01615, partial [Myxococcaceae bacterium]